MAMSLVEAASFGADAVQRLLAVARHPELLSYAAKAIVDLVGMMPVAAVDGVLDGLDPTVPQQLDIGFSIAQERLVRHHNIGSVGIALHTAAQREGLAGAWLAPTLHPLEVDHRVYLPFGGPHGTPKPERMVVEPLRKVRATTLREALAIHSLAPIDKPVSQRVLAAHEAMLQESNGKIETQAFETGAGTRTANLGPAIDLDARVYTWSPRVATFTFFLSRPGAYARSRSVWHMRYLMGQALAGVVDAPPNASFLAVMDLVEEFDWYKVEAAPGWFFDVAWDYGILGCGIGRGALLLATDTD